MTELIGFLLVVGVIALLGLLDRLAPHVDPFKGSETNPFPDHIDVVADTPR